jgi:RNA-directed DNA polymerase
VRFTDDLAVLACYQGSWISDFIETKIESWLGFELNRDKARSLTCARPVAVSTFWDIRSECESAIARMGRLFFVWIFPQGYAGDMNWYVRSRLMGHLRRRSQRTFRPPKGRSYYEHLMQLALI